MFWYLPDETKQLIDLLKTTTKSFVIEPYGDLSGGKISLSPKGAAQIIASMEKRCNGGKELVDARMSALTNHPDSYDLAPKLFDASHVANLRSIYFEIAAHQDNILSNEAKLASLVEQNLPKINQREGLKAEKINLVNRKIPGLKADIQDTTQRIQSSESRLSQVQTELPVARRQALAAQAKYDEALKQIAPHQPRHDQLVSNLRAAEADLSQSEGEISSAQREISSNNQQIQSLDRDARDLDNRIQRLRSDLPSAQLEYDRARRNYERYDSRAEIRRRLSSSSQYRTAQSNEERIRTQLNNEKEELRNLERDLTRTRSQLIKCQSVPENDCSKLAAEVKRLDGAVSSKKSMVSRLEAQHNNAQREVAKIEDEIERDVKREEGRLRNQYEIAASRLNDINAQLQQYEGERRDIVEYKIPTLQNRNNDLRNYVSDLERRVASLRLEVRATSDELNRFDQSVGYSRLQQNLNAASDQLRSANSAYDKLLVEESSLKTQIPRLRGDLGRYKEQLKASEDRLVIVDQVLVQLNSELSGFDNAKAELEVIIDSIAAQIKDAQSRYLVFFM